MVMEGILCQALLRALMAAAAPLIMEVLVPTPAIRNLVREEQNSSDLFRDADREQVKRACRPLNQGLANAYFQKVITLDMALFAFIECR